MLLPINEYSTVFENNFTDCLVRTPAWMDSANKNVHIRKTPGLTFYLLFFCSPLPVLICLPLALLFLSLTLFLPPLGENYRRIYSPDSLLSCIIRMIPKFLSSFALAPLSIYFLSFPLPFLLSFPSLFPFFPFFFTFL